MNGAPIKVVLFVAAAFASLGLIAPCSACRPESRGGSGSCPTYPDRIISEGENVDGKPYKLEVKDNYLCLTIGEKQLFQFLQYVI